MADSGNKTQKKAVAKTAPAAVASASKPAVYRKNHGTEVKTGKPVSKTGGYQRPTIKMLAEHAGCSIATVSKALSNSPVVAPETRERVLAAAQEIGYVANMRGVSLRTGRTYQAAVVMTIMPSSDNEWEGVEYAQILSGVARAMEGTPYHVSVHMARSAEEGLQVIQQIVESRLADGVIFSGTLPRDSRIDYLLERDFPFVTMGRSKHHAAYPYVDIDSEGAAYAGTKRLAERGHKRIALINPPADLMYAQQRIDGYKCALNEAGLTLDPKLIASGRLATSMGKAAVLRMAALNQPPTAYLCANEATALGITAGLGELGLKVGQDAVVIAADDINVSGYFSPPLSTFYLPIEELSRCLGEFLLRRIDGEAPQHLQRLYEPQLIERQSDRLEK